MTKDIIWIDKNPKIEKQHQLVKHAPKFFLIPLSMLFPLLLGLGDLTSFGMFAVIAVLVLFALRILKKSTDGVINYRFGVQSHIWVFQHLDNNDKQTVLPNKIYHSAGCLVANGIVFGLQNKYGEFAYDKTLFDKYALPDHRTRKSIIG